VRTFILWVKESNMKNQSEKAVDGRLLYNREHLPRLGINLSNSTMLRLEAAGQFPKRVRIGAHSVAWLASEIHEHIAKLAAERGAA
jgi:predicted DNA-binding transcriptional regulator AlpA